MANPIFRMRFSRAYWIPISAAQNAMIVTGYKPVIAGRVYVGPLANEIGFLWRLCGGYVEAC